MRKTTPKKKPILADPKYNDTIVTAFVNNMMLAGKKSTAFKVFYDSMELIKDKAKEEGISSIELWKKALENVTPSVEVKSRRIGGATFQVPREIRPERKLSVSMKSIIAFARKRSGKSMSNKLSAEILAAYNKEGAAFKKKEEMHRMAEANRAFAHFRF